MKRAATELFCCLSLSTKRIINICTLMEGLWRKVNTYWMHSLVTRHSQ